MKNILLILSISFVIFHSSIVIVQAQLQGQAMIDSLLKELPKMKEDTNRVNLLLDIAYEYIYINPDEGIKYCDKAINLSRELRWSQGVAKCLDNTAILYLYGWDDLSKALEYYKESLTIYREIGDDASIGKTLTSIGTLYGRKSDYIKALECFLDALIIYEKKEDKIGIALNYANIGNVYQSQIDNNEQQRSKNINQSLDYYFKAIKLLNEIENNESVAQVYGNIATIYHDNLKFDKALENYDKSLQYYQENGNQAGIARNLGNMANLYVDVNEYAKAFDYYQNAIKLNEQSGNKADLANNFANIGRLYSKISVDSVKNILPRESPNISKDSRKNLERAEQYLKKSIAIFEELGNKHSQFYFLRELSIVYERMRKYQESLVAYKQYTKLKDSVFSEDNNFKIASMEAKFENDRKDNEINLLNIEQERQKFEFYLLLASTLILITALVFGYLRYKDKKLLSEKLFLKNKVIEEQKTLVEEQNMVIYSTIRYASSIQQTIMPSHNRIRSSLPDIFIIHKPKDIVSDDIYWFQEVGGIRFLAVIDCNDIGIPGSMLTVIASSVLDDAVLVKKLINTDKILTYMNEIITKVLNPNTTENIIREGLAVALIAIHDDKIQFSGAGLPLYLKKRKLQIFKTDNQKIGGQTENDNYQFSSIDIIRTESIMLYLSSNGFADLMNEQNKKYSTKRFIEILESVSDRSISEQHELLVNEFDSHKGRINQIDDVTILGVRI